AGPGCGAAPGCHGDHHGGGGDRAAVPARHVAAAARCGAVAAAGVAGGGVRGAAGPHAVLAGGRGVHAVGWVLPVAAVGRVRRVVWLGGGGLGGGRVSAAPVGRVMAVLRAEWTKLRTFPGTVGLLCAVAAGTAATGAAVAATVACPSQACLDPARTSLTGVQLGQAVVAILAVLLIGEEYGSGMVRVTLAAVPRRLA